MGRGHGPRLLTSAQLAGANVGLDLHLISPPPRKLVGMWDGLRSDQAETSGRSACRRERGS